MIKHLKFNKLLVDSVRHPLEEGKLPEDGNKEKHRWLAKLRVMLARLQLLTI